MRLCTSPDCKSKHHARGLCSKHYAARRRAPAAPAPQVNAFVHVPRKSLTTLQRAKLFLEHDGKCCLCKRQIDGVRERWLVEHITALVRGGDNSRTNLAPAHERCAKPKTAEDHKAGAKGKRVYAASIGAKVAKKPMPGSRASGWKKTFSSGWVRRESL